MTFQEELAGLGFSDVGALKLSEDAWFSAAFQNKTEKLRERINGIIEAYGCAGQQATKAVLSFPSFACLNHQRVLNGIIEAYGCTKEQATKAVLSFPQFASYDHQRVINGIIDAYGCAREQATKAVMSFPPFAGLDHQRVLKGIIEAYDCTKEQASKAVLSFPSFAGLDHQRVLKGIIEAYDCTKEQASKAVLSFPPFAGLDHQRAINGIIDAYGCARQQAAKAVLPFPQFAGLDHQRVLRQLCRIGRKVGLSDGYVKEEILKRPVFASYSARRYLASIDVFRHLATNGAGLDTLMHLWKSNYGKSPYVPGAKRMRITQLIRSNKAEDYQEPPLMGALRKSIEHRAKIAARA